MKIIDKMISLFAGCGQSTTTKEVEVIPTTDFDQAFNLNQKGMECEKNQDIPNAIKYYEQCLHYKFEGSYPYSRLAILYRKQKDYDNEIRVLETAISIFNDIRPKGSRELELSKKIADFQDRLDKARIIKEKQQGQ